VKTSFCHSKTRKINTGEEPVTYVSLEVFTAVRMAMLYFRVGTLCRLIGGYKHFRVTQYLHLQG
jgi:hypothetical protein